MSGRFLMKELWAVLVECEDDPRGDEDEDED